HGGSLRAGTGHHRPDVEAAGARGGCEGDSSLVTGGLERLRLPQDPPLTEEAFKELLAAAQAGDENARRELAERNLRLVMQVAQRFRNRGASMEDLFQVGCVALLEAIDRFDAGFGVKFSTYAVP